MIGSQDRLVLAFQLSLPDTGGLCLSNLAAYTFCGFL